jgi:hypothetical protein
MRRGASAASGEQSAPLTQATPKAGRITAVRVHVTTSASRSTTHARCGSSATRAPSSGKGHSPGCARPATSSAKASSISVACKCQNKPQSSLPAAPHLLAGGALPSHGAATLHGDRFKWEGRVVCWGTDGVGTDGLGTDGWGTDGWGTDGWGTDGWGTDGWSQFQTVSGSRQARSSALPAHGTCCWNNATTSTSARATRRVCFTIQVR